MLLFVLHRNYSEKYVQKVVESKKEIFHEKQGRSSTLEEAKYNGGPSKMQAERDELLESHCTKVCHHPSGGTPSS